MKRIAILLALCVFGSASFDRSAARPARVAAQVEQWMVSIDDVTVTEGNAGNLNATFTVTLSRPIDFPAVERLRSKAAFS